MRTASLQRKTAETDIEIEVNLDGEGKASCDTGVAFLDHMLDQIARHGLMDISLKADGDTDVDFHHTTEDTGIVFGEALAKALGDKRGIVRYGVAHAPMDEALCRVAMDLSGRAHLTWRVELPRDKVGDMDSELIREWFEAFARSAQATIHVECFYGANTHHIIEGCFKALARALREAVSIDPRRKESLPSTKGVL